MVTKWLIPVSNFSHVAIVSSHNIAVYCHDLFRYNALHTSLFHCTLLHFIACI